MTHGGKRPGAGRKPSLHHVPKAQSPIRIAELKLAERLPELVEKAIEMALDGDRALLAYCIDRVLGKAVQPIDVIHEVQQIAADFGVEPARVSSIVERLKAKRAG